VRHAEESESLGFVGRCHNAVEMRHCRPPLAASRLDFGQIDVRRRELGHVREGLCVQRGAASRIRALLRPHHAAGEVNPCVWKRQRRVEIAKRLDI
jgi:hypothetical protein